MGFGSRGSGLAFISLFQVIVLGTLMYNATAHGCISSLIRWRFWFRTSGLAIIWDCLKISPRYPEKGPGNVP